jgi:hypothetical protein
MNDYDVELLLERAVFPTERERRALESRHAIAIEHPRLLDDRGELDAAVARTWGWPDAAREVERAVAAVRVRDLAAPSSRASTASTASTSPTPSRAARLHAFCRAVDQVARACEARAIHWRPAERIVCARTLAQRLGEWGPLAGAALNVRQFQLEDAGVTVLDTIGLAALGLPDVECRASGVAPERMAAILGSCADWLLAHGDVIRDGETLDRAAERWTCRRDRSLAAPHRPVLALVPRRRSAVA